MLLVRRILRILIQLSFKLLKNHEIFREPDLIQLNNSSYFGQLSYVCDQFWYIYVIVCSFLDILSAHKNKILKNKFTLCLRLGTAIVWSCVFLLTFYAILSKILIDSVSQSVIFWFLFVCIYFLINFLYLLH